MYESCPTRRVLRVVTVSAGQSNYSFKAVVTAWIKKAIQITISIAYSTKDGIKLTKTRPTI